MNTKRNEAVKKYLIKLRERGGPVWEAYKERARVNRKKHYHKNKTLKGPHTSQVSKSKEYKLWIGAKLRCRKSGREFAIELSDIVIPDVCPVLNIHINKEGGPKSWNSPSLDRIDSSKGYTKDNIVLMSWRANCIKNMGTAEEHRLIADWMDERAKFA